MKQLDFFNRATTAFQVHSARQALEEKYAGRLREDFRLAGLVSYVGNKDIPLLRLYRYKEAFAYRFVEEFINRFQLGEQDYIFDPFCGMGTTPFVASLKGIAAIGIDKLPIAVFIAQTLSRFGELQSGEIRDTFERLKEQVAGAPPAYVATDVAIMSVAFPEEIFLRLRQWKTVIGELKSPLREVFLLLLFSVLEVCSYTAKDGQFLRLVKEKLIANPDEAIEQKVKDAERDLVLVRQLGWEFTPRPLFFPGDTRSLAKIPFERPPTAIITSPPYANRYDYTRTYSLELCFHFVRDFGELKSLRQNVLRSHIESKKLPNEQPSHPVVVEVVQLLRQHGKALNNPRIPDMLTAYFIDMQKAIAEWGRVLARGARVALVVDNVRFAGELLPVDLVLSELAEETGFEVEEVLVARYKGNSSQQMGKYGRVPVRESIVVWRKR